MCTGKCAKCIGVILYPLSLISIICNILLFFPDWTIKYAEKDQEDGNRITEEVKYMGGVIGGGIMVLIPAIHIHLTSKQGCCGNRCGMFLSIGFSAVGMVGALYSMSVSALGLANGPTCLYIGNNFMPGWGTPFKDNNGSYLGEPDSWKRCLEPEDVVEFNVILFSILLVASIAELVLCGFQMVNGLFGCLCGTCSSKGQSA